MFEHFHYMSNAFDVIKATEGEANALCPHCPLCIYVNLTKWLKHVEKCRPFELWIGEDNDSPLESVDREEIEECEEYEGRTPFEEVVEDEDSDFCECASGAQSE